MEKLYRIRPLEKNSVEYFVDVYERLSDGSIRGFDVTEIWRWGLGYRPEDEPVWKFETGDHGIHCNPKVGWGCELDNLCAVYINFSDGFTAEEKSEIEAILRYEKQDGDGRSGTVWIYDGDHNWEIEDQHVRFTGPVQIDFLDEQGEVIEENVETYDSDAE
jgi:hypothetical protein